MQNKMFDFYVHWTVGSCFVTGEMYKSICCVQSRTSYTYTGILYCVFRLIGRISEHTLLPSAINNRDRFLTNNLALGVLWSCWVLNELWSTCLSCDVNGITSITTRYLSHHSGKSVSQIYVIVPNDSLQNKILKHTQMKSTRKWMAFHHFESNLEDSERNKNVHKKCNITVDLSISQYQWII